MHMPALDKTGFSIRPGTVEDIDDARDIETAALELLHGHSAYGVFSRYPMDRRSLEEATRESRWWVAAVELRKVGYAMLDRIDGAAYLAQMDVHPAHGRRGIGRRLLEHVCCQSMRHGFTALYLVTLRDVPWNAPFYAKAGFVEVFPDQWGPQMQALIAHEAELEFPMDLRIVMRRSL